MTARDTASYVVAVEFRSRKTLMVEGTTDKGIIASLIHACSRKTKKDGEIVIDTPDEIDKWAPKMGAWQKVEMAANACVAAHTTKFAALVDRDFREFVYDRLPLEDRLNTHRVVNGLIHWTRGHSIESYLIHPDGVLAYIQSRYAAHVSGEAIEIVDTLFPKLLEVTACLSIAFYINGCSERMTGAFDESIWQATGSAVRLEPSQLCRVCSSRGIDAAHVSKIEATYSSLIGGMSAIGSGTRWIGHGKSAFELVWAAVAAVLSNAGVEKGIVREIAIANKQDKLDLCAGEWASGCAEGSSESPTDLMRFIGGARLVPS